MSVISRLRTESRGNFSDVISRVDPALFRSLQDKELPSFHEWELVQEILFDEYAQHWDENYTPDEEGRRIDDALGAFMWEFPQEILPDDPDR